MADVDPRLDPSRAHPLNAADCVRSQARLADVELGLTDPVDGQYWRDKAIARVAALDEEEFHFGLAPHEDAERDQLRAMLANLNARLAR